MILHKGTTPTHFFTIPNDLKDLIKIVQISYAQYYKVLVQKKTEDCMIDGNVISVKLSQEETLKFSAGIPVQVQIRVVTTNDDALVSDIVTMDVHKVLGNEVLE